MPYIFNFLKIIEWLRGSKAGGNSIKHLKYTGYFQKIIKFGLAIVTIWNRTVLNIDLFLGASRRIENYTCFFQKKLEKEGKNDIGLQLFTSLSWLVLYISNTRAIFNLSWNTEFQRTDWLYVWVAYITHWKFWG